MLRAGGELSKEGVAKERRTTPQKTATGDREDAALVVVVAVGASVCGVDGSHSGHLLALGLGLGEVRPDQPEVVRAQVLARHSAARRSFDCHAALNRDWSFAGSPLLNGWRGDTKKTRKGCLPADLVACGLDKALLCHAPYDKATPYLGQQELPNTADERQH